MNNMADLVVAAGAPELTSMAHARSHNGLIWVTGMVGRDPNSGDFGASDFASQFSQAISNLEVVLEAAGSSLSRVIRTQIQYVNQSDAPALSSIYRSRFTEPWPARSSYGVDFLYRRNGVDAVVQIDCVASPHSLDAKASTVMSDDAPATNGYSHGRVHGPLIWVTGMIGRDPRSGEVIDDGFKAQFHLALDNLEAVLRAAKSSLSKVIHTQIQYMGQSNVAIMNEVFRDRFGSARPARTSWGVPFLWRTAMVQIDCVAIAGVNER